uniref:Uncharacterized protein LOC111128027 n=1 Tax=Crassostrea virginica TaxID=6565 RepID=A0A8B8DMY1_CRAVI|nr:uncharacterized protein LOC111128027 [Crassostrea virginica]XP_022329116.1 uncharacterized protein LOC111128027 [Crassostrea virginica]XP_022329125.1 uncharacterized protein LOC111128027 [Crassostrea virginica]
MAKNNGVGIGLPLHTVINQHIRLNFDVDGYGHHLTMKLRCELLGETKANPSLWLRPSTADKPFRTSMSLYDILSSNENFPPIKQKEEGGAKMRGYICNSQRLVNYLRTAVTECWSFRPCCSNQEIPSGVQVRQISSNKPVACLIPVVEHREYNGKQHLKLHCWSWGVVALTACVPLDGVVQTSLTLRFTTTRRRDLGTEDKVGGSRFPGH